jgi:NAD-dependent deacetylase
VPDVEIAQIAKLIRFSRALVAFTGAGISTASGIPDFRSPHSGLWNQVDPIAVASLYGFRQNPAAFYDWVRPLARTILAAAPNEAHLALSRLEALGKLKAIVTQNIDMLHQRAGNSIVHELHGHLREATCIHCFRVYPIDDMLDAFLEQSRLPYCENCGAVLKPNVILFGEQLPHRAFRAAQQAVSDADLLLVVGTSLEVAPASDLPLLALRNRAHVVVINMEPTSLDHAASVVIHGDAAQILPEIVQELEALG